MKAWKMNLRFVALMALICCAASVGSQTTLAQCPASPAPEYVPDFSSNQNCLTLNGTPSDSGYPGFFAPAFSLTPPPGTTNPAQPAPAGVTKVLRLTTNGTFTSGSAWFNLAQPVAGTFSTTFTFQLSNSSTFVADGFAFVIQNVPTNPLNALDADNGADGCSLGFGDAPTNHVCTSASGGITNSLAVGFDTYQNSDVDDPNGNHVEIQSCGLNANSVEASPLAGSCQLANSTLANLLDPRGNPLTLADGYVHTVTIKFTPSGACASSACPGILDVVLDNNDLFPAVGEAPEGVPFDMASIGLTNGTAYVGFTGATGGGDDDQDILSWTFSITGSPVVAGVPQTFNFSQTPNALDIVTATFPNTQTLQNTGVTPTITVVPTPPANPSALWAGSPLATAVCTPIASANGNCAPINEVCAPPLPASGANCPYESNGAQDVLLSDTYDPSTPITNLNLVGDPGVVALNDSLTCPFAAQGSLSAPACPSNGSKALTGPNQLKTTHGTSNSYYYYVTGVLSPSITPSGFVTVGGINWVNGHNTAPITLTATPPATPMPNPTRFYPSPIDYVAYLNLVASAVPPAPDPTLPPFTFPPSASTEGTVVYSPNVEASNVVTPTGPTTSVSTCPGVINAATGQVFPAASTYSFPVPANVGPLAENTYSLFYETEDCNRTAERQYTYVAGSPSTWVTSYKSLTFNVDDTPPVIAIATPSVGAIYAANASIPSNFTCMDTAGSDGNSGIAPAPNGCYGMNPLKLQSGGAFDTKPTGGILTSKTFTVTATDNVGNTSSKNVTYSVSCLYAENSISPSSLTPGKLFIFKITAAVTNCTASSQALTVNIVLSGPLGKSCSNIPVTLVPSFTVTVAAGKSVSQTFGPLILPTNACTNFPYVLTTTTSNKGIVVFTYSSTISD
jgi:hypothetical protein